MCGDPSPAEAHCSDVFGPTLLLQELQHCIHFSEEKNVTIKMNVQQSFFQNKTDGCHMLLVYIRWLLVLQPLLKTGPVTGWTPRLLSNIKVWTHCSEEMTVYKGQTLEGTIFWFEQLCYSHVSVGSQHVSHVSGVGELPAIDVLYDNDGPVRRRRGLHHIGLDVLNLDLMAKPPIVHPVTNVTGARPGLVSHLEGGRQALTCESA